ncbi:MAG: hypothetical protein NVS2B9_12250 [Myxococcales bacterium]
MPLAELHPFVLHFAVALLLAAPGCDALGLLLRRQSLLQAGRWNTLVGAAAAILAVLTGLWAQAALPPHSAAGAALVSLHRALGFLTVGVWIPVALWRTLVRSAFPLRLRTLYLAASFAGAALVLAQAALGSALVYRHGVGLSAGARAEPLQRGAPAAAGVSDRGGAR